MALEATMESVKIRKTQTRQREGARDELLAMPRSLVLQYPRGT